MDPVNEAKTEFRLQQWTKIIQTCQGSGMTVVAWCAKNDINIKTYYYWLRRLRILALTSSKTTACTNEHSIVPVAYQPSRASNAAAITIHLPSVSIDIHEGASRAAIEDVLHALKNIC
ncbi:MAG: IS66 family insertion sequence element accessory protein TnpB [Syntrophomonas sp.]